MSKFYTKKTKNGFTLMELLISVSIITIISSVVLINHSKFSSSTQLGNLSYDIALSIREAQTYGINVQGFGSNFDVGYGVHFDSNNSWILFADVNRNSEYDAGDGIVDNINLQGGYTLSEISATTVGGTTMYFPSNINFLDITFSRPNPDATFKTNLSETYQNARITITAPDGVSTRSILINTTGFISINNP